MNPDDVVVRGAATPDEVAAVLAVLRSRERVADAAGRYERWRRRRLASISPR